MDYGICASVTLSCFIYANMYWKLEKSRLFKQYILCNNWNGCKAMALHHNMWCQTMNLYVICMHFPFYQPTNERPFRNVVSKTCNQSIFRMKVTRLLDFVNLSAIVIGVRKPWTCFGLWLLVCERIHFVNGNNVPLHRLGTAFSRRK